MCGIAGIVDGRGVGLDRLALGAMADSMKRRGPDDSGIWGDDTALLAHRRLAIIDLSPGGHQPMVTDDGQLVVVFNGEIYNFVELRRRLEGLGHSFRSRSDTETILHAYRQWGEDGVRELDGMFALALWDRAARRLLLARDRFGKKPLYYYQNANLLVFASTLTALLHHPDVPRAIDRDALAEYLALEYVVAPRTLLAGVAKLEPAHLLSFDAGRGTVEKRRYWKLGPLGGSQLDETEAERELERLLSAAVEKRLVSDVPLGIFVSGGVDSSLVAALAAARHGSVRTFSVRFDDPSFDESRWARLVAARLGTQHVEEELAVDAAADIVAGLGDILDEPIGDGSIVPTYLLSRFARRHVTVALGGDGGDELFAGYPTYVAHRLADWSGPLRRPLIARALRAVAGRLPVSHDYFSFDFKLKKLLGGLDHRRDERNYVWLGAFDQRRLRALLGAEHDVYRVARERYAEASGSHLERVLYQDLGLYMTHSVLAKVDRASMAASLEVRAPLLDTAVVELVASLPLHHKLRRLTGKYLFKKLARRYLPPEIVDRPKKGFGMPVGRWLRGRLQPLARDALLDGQSLAVAGLLERREVARLLDEHVGGVVDHRQRLWTLLVLELWHRALPVLPARAIARGTAA